MESEKYRRKPQRSVVSRVVIVSLEAGLKALLSRRGGLLVVLQYQQHHRSHTKSSALVVLRAGALSAAANVAKHKWWSAWGLSAVGRGEIDHFRGAPPCG